MDLHKRADLKKIAEQFGFGRLSFCNPDELMHYLNITPGSVTPLCIMFDTEKKVKVLFDKNFEGKKVIIHPLRNTASISLTFEDLKRFTEHFGHTWHLLVSDEAGKHYILCIIPASPFVCHAQCVCRQRHIALLCIGRFWLVRSLCAHLLVCTFCHPAPSVSQWFLSTIWSRSHRKW